ncbi:MAG: LacI family DNA-binding transcriptional regulator [bacterium]|nr:LacI family DNA-binding transcriptional regulator [bacterium]
MTKQVTIKDIAKHLGISHSTVSRALAPNRKALVNEKTRKRVRQTAAEMGYSPNLMARGIVTGKSGTLGLLTYRLSAGGFESITENLMVEAHKKGYQILMELAVDRQTRDPLDDQQLQIEQLISRGVDGLLIHTRGHDDESERIRQAVRGRVPLVTFSYPIEKISAVVLDRVAGFYEATEHLIGLGHKQIAFVGPDWKMGNRLSAKGKGYFLAMLKHKLNPVLLDQNEHMGTTMEEGYQVGRRLGARSTRPTALVCRTDHTAIGISRGLQENRIRVPEDMAIVGMGDTDFSPYFTPPLTTQAQPTEAISRIAIDMVMKQLEGQTEIEQVTLKLRLVVRESCGAKKAEKLDKSA